ncbi:MAG TPA: hypothetical protein VKM72_22885 [Thermoanaerobaculia bacterium]|nr:hypothetical protein [Thermoanaerobaculia bacterium]
MTVTQERGMITSCMSQTISGTLAEIAGLASPVIRSCHLGNAAANNYGWLALAGNTYLGPTEHTLYGVDDVYLPWAVLRDGGVVEACYNHRGELIPELAGRHAGELKRHIPRKHSSFFCFGIFGEHAGGDLITDHYRSMADLARQYNGSECRPRSREILALRPLVAEIIRCFHRKRRLDLLFHKWVRSTRGGQVVSLKIQRIETLASGDLAIYGADSALIFQGSIDALIDSLFAGLGEVSHRLVDGSRMGVLGYPWLTVVFNIVLNAVKEHAVDPAQRVFWHASGAMNHLYANQDWFQRDFAQVVDTLGQEGSLPSGAELRMIPTLACQLFATCPASLGSLEALIACWREGLRDLDPPFLAELARLLADFNAIDPNRLPIAYLADARHPSYNKYGISQRSLRSVRPLFPAGLSDLTWGEAELLVRTLARLAIDRREG